MSRDAVGNVACQRLAYWSALQHLATKATTEMLPVSAPTDLVEAHKHVATHAAEQVKHWREFVVTIPKPLAR